MVTEPQIALVIDARRVIIEALTQQIRRIETVVRQELKDTPAYRRLQTVNGIGPILAWTIGLEVGDIYRFARVGQFASYCGCVQSCALSNGKKKGVRMLQRIFKENDATVAQRIAMTRIARSATMLENIGAKGVTITETAFACGFRDLTTFERSFCAIKGMTPSAWRRRALE